MLDLRDSSGRPVTADEYLDKALCTFSEGGQAPGGDLRQRLRGFFSRQSCVTLVRPAAEESQIKDLPYSSMKSEFKAGVEAIHAQLIATCRANPKTVAGQPLSCVAFVAVARQLVNSMNNRQQLSLKTAWDTAQHGGCGSLADQLRSMALVTLKTLQAGEALPGGAQLPLADEALRMVLRQQRHELKAQWDEQAVGEESVRREYWQEMKESFARDERMVMQQNAKLADQRLKDALQAWQRFLDDDTGEGGSGEAGERIAAELALLMERMPTAPLCRAARAAIELAGRRVAAARAELRAARAGETPVKSSATYQAKSNSAGVENELREAKVQLQDQRLQIQDGAAQLHDAKFELERLLADIESSRVREQELKAQQRDFADKEAAWRAELEDVHVSAAKSEADHLHSERLLKSELAQVREREENLRLEVEQLRRQADGHSHNDAEKRRLEAELEHVRGHVAAKGEIEAELESVRISQVAERNRLEEELSLARAHAANKGQLEADLERVRAAQAAERSQLEDELQKVRGQAAERNRVEAELERLRESQTGERQRLEAELEEAKAQAAQKARLEAELEQARKQAEEQKKLQEELERVRAQAEEYKQKLTNETSNLQKENEKTRTEHLRMVEDARQRLEEERRSHAEKLGGERDRLLERERNAGVLEGRVDAISAEANSLRQRISELQNKVVEVEGQKGAHVQEKDKLRQDLESARNSMTQTQEELRKRTELYEKRLEEQSRKSQPKCGCTVQ